MIGILLTVLGSLATATLFAMFALAGVLVEAHELFPADRDRRPLADRARAAVRAALTGRTTETPATLGQAATR